MLCLSRTHFHGVFIAIFLTSMTLSANVCQAQTKRYSVKGVVTDDKGKSIDFANVSLNGDIATNTKGNGSYTISNLSRGVYIYKVSYVGYQTHTDTIDVRSDMTVNVRLKQLCLELDNVVVTANQVSMGSKSVVSEDAIRHIQPKSVSDLLQLVPGNLTENPNLNDLSQAKIREIDTDDNNAMGTSVIVDGTPLSNDANLQAISPTRYGTASSAQADGMANQTTAGRGVDLRTVSAGNIESMEVIRGIPSVEYGNLTSGLMIVKTKSGYTPWEVKVQADPFSKLVFAGKGFALRQGGAVNFSIDWSQSWGDTRKHYLGYDRITATAGYSNTFGPLSLNVKGAVYSNINNYKKDPQYEEQDLHYKNKNIGARLSVNGSYRPANGFINRIDYNLSAQVSKTSDEHYDLISSPDGVITDNREPGVHEAVFKNQSYHSEYKIKGLPINLYAQLIGNKYIQLGEANHTNIKLGMEYTYDANKGDGLIFDMSNPPQSQSSRTLRPRAYKDIPALRTLSGFVSDKLTVQMGGGTQASLEGGIRVSSLFLDKDKTGGRSHYFVAEPRINATVSLLNKRNNNLFDDLSITGGFGVSNKMPTLLYLYPDNVYYDNASLSKYGEAESDRLALLSTDVITQTQNNSLKPAHSQKWEIGLSFRLGKVKGFVTYFNEHHKHEFGFDSQLYWSKYVKYSVPTNATSPQFNAQTGDVTYNVSGVTMTADKTYTTDMVTWSMPSNNTRSLKHGIEYGLDFGTFKPLRTSLSINGAWFHIDRTSETTSLNYINKNFDYVSVMPSGYGTVRDRINTNFRFITHIPAVKMIFTTTVQVVWYESTRYKYCDENGKDRQRLITYQGREYYAVDPVGYYDRSGNYTAWSPELANDSQMALLMDRFQTYGFEKDVIKPWAMLNFRFTKEIGRIAELSFIANNFLNTSKWHTNKHTLAKSQIYPDMYFGAEVKVKL